MGKSIKCGMVGGHLDAFIGEVHRKAIGFDPRAELVSGCFSSNSEKNIQTGETYSLESDRIYSDYHEMAEKESAREDGINFVSIVTPNSTHYQIAKAFLEKGINVVCEKPLCFTIEEAVELVKLSKENKLLFGITYAYTGYTMSKVIKEMIAQGKIGNIVAVNGEYLQDWLLDELSMEAKGKQDLSVWRKDPKLSGISNCVGDIGTHIENYVHYVTGLEIKRVAATINTFGHPLELNANILVQYENNINGAYWCSQITAGKLNGLSVRIYGDKGAIEWEQHYPDYVKFTPKGQPTQIISRGQGYLGNGAATQSRLPSGHPEGLFVAFANIYRSYISALIKKNNGEKLVDADLDFPSVTDGLNGVRFVHAVINSGKNDSEWTNIK
ncbi:MAG: Gfo/Idh/MocA family oxidoreductase [Peptostreptococcaceae bacterium]|nr:Gfo/Idh/MocA family oxidoreductase [Peptostreptococcaceae bacterium]